MGISFPVNVTNLTIKLTDSVKDIRSKVNVGIADHINGIFANKRSYLTKEISYLIGVWVRSQPEMLSLATSSNDNSLRGHFGLPDGSETNAVDMIVKSIQQSTEISIKKIDNKLQGGITFRCQPSHFANLLGLPVGHTQTKPPHENLHWLRALLESGLSPIVVGYHYTPGKGFGRSHIGRMAISGAWAVPPDFAGTLDNNFITRAFDKKEKDLNALFSRILKG